MNKHTEEREAEALPAVVYVSRLPYGFDDKTGRTFFKQFGEVKGICYPRSSKTGRSKGYMFILFSDMNVAKVVAKTIDGYYAFGKSLYAKILDKRKKILYEKFKSDKKKFNFIPWQKIFQKNFNTTQKEDRLKNKFKKLLEEDRRKKLLFIKKGFDYSYTTYENLVSEHNS